MDDISEKPWWESKTIVGAIVAMIGVLASMFGFEVVDNAAVSEIIMELMSIAGLLFAIYGRIVAEKPIKSNR